MKLISFLGTELLALILYSILILLVLITVPLSCIFYVFHCFSLIGEYSKSSHPNKKHLTKVL